MNAMQFQLRFLVALLPALVAACAQPDETDVGPRDDGAVEDSGENGEADGDMDVDGDEDGAADSDVPDPCTDPVCAIGDRRCDPPPATDTIYRECVADAMGCPMWGPQQECSAGQFCEEGSCVDSCTDVCTTGVRQCASESEYQDCVAGPRGCLTWDTPVACGSGLACTGAGECTPCTDQCEVDLARCNAAGEPITCATGPTGCLAWTTGTACALPEICWEGACAASCTSICTAGQMRCFGDDYQVCMRQPAGCYGWSAPYACPAGRACAGAGACPSCSDACAEGEGRCTTATAYERCEINLTTSCYEWTPETECGLHEACEGAGACTTICTDACAGEGTLECGPGGEPRVCQIGSLGCLEWSAETPCAAVTHGLNVCVAGLCELTCDDGFLACGPAACRASCTPWTQQSPVPPYEELWSADFVGTTVWVVGSSGVISRSADRGVTWLNVGAAPGGTALYGVDFATATVGWAVGAGGAILRSDDAGATWTAQTSGVTTILRGVSFFDASNGWAVGDAGVILATTNGGTTWTRQSSSITTTLYGVHFVSATTGWAVGASGRILKTANGGAVWLPQTSGSTYDVRGVRFIDANNGWAVGYSYAYRTTNGGTTWAAFTRSLVNYNAVYATSATSAVIVGAGGRVETTTDGGVVWSSRTSGTTSNLNALVLLDALNALTVGQNGAVLTSSNGGSTWIDRRGGTSDNLRDVQFVDATHGWAVGAAGRIVATVDGGAIWTAQTSGTTGNLWGVRFVDLLHGWAVGDGGVVRATVDGGTTWTAQSSTSTGALYAVHFIDANEGWAVGAYMGTSSVRYTPDGGTTWMAEPTGVPSGITMNGVWFNASGRGWIVGAGGNVRYTNDRGVSWLTPVSTGTIQALWDVRFVSDTAGFAVGAAGTLIVTTDGGAHWTLRGTPVTGILYALAFVDANNGFAAGAAGTFIKTIDGGSSWSSFPAPTTRDLRGISFLNIDEGWVAGDFGTILSTVSGGE
jgi:photosystem II stability/assembly factor-like uncharacterized protein